MTVFKAKYDQFGESSVPGSATSGWVTMTDVDIDTADGAQPDLTTLLASRNHFKKGDDRSPQGFAVMLRVGYPTSVDTAGELTTSPVVNLWGQANIGGVTTPHEPIPNSSNVYDLEITVNPTTDHSEDSSRWTRGIGPIDILNNNRVLVTVLTALVTAADDSLAIVQIKAV